MNQVANIITALRGATTRRQRRTARAVATRSQDTHRPWDTTPGRSAREWFAILRPRLHTSRPVISERDGVVTLGAPTFRNVINENGEHV